MPQKPVACTVNVVFSSDWELSPGAGFRDAKEDLRRCIPVDACEEIKLELRTPGGGGMRLDTIFPALRPGPDFKVLVVMAHTAPVSAAGKPDPKHVSGQYLSLSAKGVFAYIQFERAAALIRKTAKSARYDMILLACCQGDKLLELLKPAMHSDGVIAYFGGPDESPTDGVHLFLAQDMVEKALELLHARVAAGAPLSAVELFRQLYTQLGQEYVGPSDARRLDKDGNGEYLYSEYVLTRSSESVLAHPAYVKDYMLAGHLHGFAMASGELVDGLDLVAERAELMAQVQRDADRAHGEKKKEGEADAPPSSRG